MPTYRVETTVPPSRTLTITHVPFQAGDQVEVIVRQREQPEKQGERYPLRGKLIRYTDPFESVAESEWEALK